MLTNILAGLGLVSVIVSLINSKKKPAVIILSLAVGIAILIVNVVKSNKDATTATESKRDSDSLKTVILNTSKNAEESVSKLKIANVYLARLDSLGIKRDSLNNLPRVTKKFTNYINHVETLNQY